MLIRRGIESEAGNYYVRLHLRHRCLAPGVLLSLPRQQVGSGRREGGWLGGARRGSPTDPSSSLTSRKAEKGHEKATCGFPAAVFFFPYQQLCEKGGSVFAAFTSWPNHTLEKYSLGLSLFPYEGLQKKKVKYSLPRPLSPRPTTHQIFG